MHGKEDAARSTFPAFAAHWSMDNHDNRAAVGGAEQTVKEGSAREEAAAEEKNVLGLRTSLHSRKSGTCDPWSTHNNLQW